MTFVVAALVAFLVLFALDRAATVPWFVRAAVAVATALLAAWAYEATLPRAQAVQAVAAGAAGLVLSEVVAMLQAATDALRMRVLAATRRPSRLPPL